MDCRTPKGKEYIRLQNETKRHLQKLGYHIFNIFGDESPSDIVIARPIDGELTIVGVGEIKVRETVAGSPISIQYVKDNGYLITESKITEGLKTGYVLNCPFYVIVNLLPEKKILIWKLDFEYETRTTQTQKSCNGGIAERVNAFLPFDKCKTINYE